MGWLDWLRQCLPFGAGESPELPKGVSVHDPGDPEFLGQLAGVTAELFLAEFRRALADLPQVQRAYFCKVRFPAAERVEAALGVVSTSGEDMRVVEALAPVIRANVESGSHIDLLFLSPSLEARLTDVCQPFYEHAEPS